MKISKKIYIYINHKKRDLACERRGKMKRKNKKVIARDTVHFNGTVTTNK